MTRVDHPLIAHLLTELRDQTTPSSRFREAIAVAGALLAYEATADIALADAPIETPLESHIGRRLAKRVTVVPIMRAGMGLADRMLGVIPGAQMGHIGLFRDEQSLEPVSYYEKLPRRIEQGPVLLVDPMLATGGSAVAGARRLLDRGCEDIRFVCLVAAPEGLAAFHDALPHVPVITAAIDRELDDRGFICPGLGDAGDRVFGTTE